MTTMPPELGDSRKTQEMLWKQIKEQGHLPGFSNVVEIGRASCREREL